MTLSNNCKMTFYNYNIVSKSIDQYSKLTKYVKLKLLMMYLLIHVSFSGNLYIWPNWVAVVAVDGVSLL